MADPGKGKGKAASSSGGAASGSGGRWPTVRPATGPFPRGIGELQGPTDSDRRDLDSARAARRVSSMLPAIPAPPTSSAAAAAAASSSTGPASPPPPTVPTIGVAPRPGQGYDLSRFEGRPGAHYAPLLPTVTEPPRGSSRSAVRDFERDLPIARREALASPEDSRRALAGMHGLILTGDSNRNPHQTGATDELARMQEPTTPASREERDSRDAFETEMIRQARNRGMPTLGFCGGSWRLLAAYGGHAETIPREADRGAHQGRLGDATHGLSLMPDSLVGGAAASPDGRVTGANSTHWAQAAVGADGELAQRPGTAPTRDNPSAPDVARDLRISGTEPRTGTVEAFESRHGAPVIGVQSHPEYYLASAPRSRAARDFADFGNRLFTHFEQATRAYAGRQAVNQELLARVPKVRATHRGVGSGGAASAAAAASSSGAGGASSSSRGGSGGGGEHKTKD